MGLQSDDDESPPDLSGEAPKALVYVYGVEGDWLREGDRLREVEELRIGEELREGEGVDIFFALAGCWLRTGCAS
jgi:hypothetical protein